MLNRVNLVDRVEVSRQGCVRARMKKIVMREGMVVGWRYHRFSIAPGRDAGAYMDRVSAHLKSTQAAELGEAERAKVDRWVSAFHTSEAVEACRERQAHAEREETLDAELHGAIVFDLIAVAYKTPACPPERIDGLVAARPAQIIAGMEPAYLPQLNVPRGQFPDTPQILRDYLRPAPGGAETKETIVAQGKDAVIAAVAGTSPTAEEWGRLGTAVSLEQ